ncbi:uncharacterized protein LOC110989453 [Acanthaster planci]|uniref:Uncharacterized protein LOC110989453 n=1 Tax=Acanthaster planci TaxID=133434 RepID=A0A8B8A114_ACAPL|nr:uncharacterized protein LOC110989453 [Acanthaster planci]
MMGMSLALLFLLAVTSTVGALQCHSCHNVIPPYPDCEKALNWKPFTDCSSRYGFVTRCGNMNGILSSRYHQVFSELKDVELDCMEFDPSHVPENKCYHDEEALPWIMDNTPWSLMPPSIDLKSMTFEFKGTLCICDTDWCNGALP